MSAPSTGIGVGPRVRPSRSYRAAQTRAAYMFVTPFLVVFVAMLIIPLGYAAYLSLFRSQLIGGMTFTGLDNFKRALTDANFLSGVGRMAFFLAIQVPVMLGLALLFALVLDSGRLRFPRVMRLAIFVPYAIPGVVAALMWGYLYGNQFGPVAQITDFFGLPAPQFLAPGSALYSLMNIVTWGYTGYNMVILYAAMRSIPTELYEAARVDGAGAIRIAWSIKIPAVRPALLLTAIFSIIGSFQLFNEPSILRPLALNAITTDYTPNFYTYSLSFNGQQHNYSAAVAIIMGLITMVIAYVVQLRGMRKGA